MREPPLILVVDDVPDNVEILQLRLESQGYEIITAGDGETRYIGPGEVVLVEDTTGKGHISKFVGGAMRRSIFVALD